MKLSVPLLALTIVLLLITNAPIYGQCGSHSEHNDKSEKSTKKSETAKTSTEITNYVCPMHPEITSMNPGTCSKCGMNLELKKANSGKTEQTKDSVYYTCSMHPKVKETKPGNCPKCGMELIKKSGNDTSSKENMKMMCPMKME